MTEKTKEICNLLNNMGINFKLIKHKAVYTIDEMAELNLPDTDAIAKNLFVRDDKKRNYYLLVVRQEKKVDLQVLKERICSRPLSFASESDLNSILGLSKGAVTPLGVINDEERKVKVMIDRAFNKSLIGIHPNENIATIWLDAAELVNIIEKHGNSVEFIEI